MGKKKKKRISGKSEVAFSNLGKELNHVKKGVKEHSVADNPNTKLLESETGLSKCDRCMFRFYESEDCSWLRENGCSDKCKGFKSSLYCFGFVDINKVKNINTNSDIELQKKLKQYLPVAEKINKVIQDEEIASDRRKRLEKIRQKIIELQKLDETEDKDDIAAGIENKPKRRNLKSLI